MNKETAIDIYNNIINSTNGLIKTTVCLECGETVYPDPEKLYLYSSNKVYEVVILDGEIHVNVLSLPTDRRVTFWQYSCWRCGCEQLIPDKYLL